MNYQKLPKISPLSKEKQMGKPDLYKKTKQEIPGPEIPHLWHSRERPSHGFFDHFGGPWVTNTNLSAAAWFNQKMDGTCDEK